MGSMFCPGFPIILQCCLVTKTDSSLGTVDVEPSLRDSMLEAVCCWEEIHHCAVQPGVPMAHRYRGLDIGARTAQCCRIQKVNLG